MERFKVLRDSDLWVDQTVDNNAVAMGKMSQAGGGAGPCTKKNTQGKHKKRMSWKEMSWLWTASGAPDEHDNASLHCCKYLPLVPSRLPLSHMGIHGTAVRVEWVKACA